jgi:DNA polymerase eta
MKIIDVFKEGLPTGEIGMNNPGACAVCLININAHQIEKASIDEAFIDFTHPVREIILERFPYLAHVPADAPNGIDTPLPSPPPISWEGLGVIVPVSPASEKTEEQPQSSIGGNGFEDEVREESDELATWHDVALSIAAELMEKIRYEVRTKLGYTTSAVNAVSR